jgi:hypothetical protein
MSTLEYLNALAFGPQHDAHVKAWLAFCRAISYVPIPKDGRLIGAWWRGEE